MVSASPPASGSPAVGTELFDLDIERVDGVEQPATRRRFLFMKAEVTPTPGAGAAPALPATPAAPADEGEAAPAAKDAADQKAVLTCAQQLLRALDGAELSPEAVRAAEELAVAMGMGRRRASKGDEGVASSIGLDPTQFAAALAQGIAAALEPTLKSLAAGAGSNPTPAPSAAAPTRTAPAPAPEPSRQLELEAAAIQKERGGRRWADFDRVFPSRLA